MTPTQPSKEQIERAENVFKDFSALKGAVDQTGEAFGIKIYSSLVDEIASALSAQRQQDCARIRKAINFVAAGEKWQDLVETAFDSAVKELK